VGRRALFTSSDVRGDAIDSIRRSFIPLNKLEMESTVIRVMPNVLCPCEQHSLCYKCENPLL
jgi:hypothetical protein